MVRGNEAALIRSWRENYLVFEGLLAAGVAVAFAAWDASGGRTAVDALLPLDQGSPRSERRVVNKGQRLDSEKSPASIATDENRNDLKGWPLPDSNRDAIASEGF